MLPRIFKPFYVEFSELTRIGSLYDGGYILTKELIKNTNHCVSFGISDNFDFDINNHELIITRIDGKSGWGQDLKIKIINNDNNSEKIYNIGTCDENSLRINIDYSEET
jgi:hypothetical protein